MKILIDKYNCKTFKDEESNMDANLFYYSGKDLRLRPFNDDKLMNLF